MIRRPPRSTLSSSSAASDVYKRQYRDCPSSAADIPIWRSTCAFPTASSIWSRAPSTSRFGTPIWGTHPLSRAASLRIGKCWWLRRTTSNGMDSRERPAISTVTPVWSSARWTSGGSKPRTGARSSGASGVRTKRWINLSRQPLHASCYTGWRFRNVCADLDDPASCVG